MELAKITFLKKRMISFRLVSSLKNIFINLNSIFSKLVCKNKTFFVDDKVKSNLE